MNIPKRIENETYSSIRIAKEEAIRFLGILTDFELVEASLDKETIQQEIYEIKRASMCLTRALSDMRR